MYQAKVFVSCTCLAVLVAIGAVACVDGAGDFPGSDGASTSSGTSAGGGVGSGSASAGWGGSVNGRASGGGASGGASVDGGSSAGGEVGNGNATVEGGASANGAGSAGWSAGNASGGGSGHGGPSVGGGSGGASVNGGAGGGSVNAGGSGKNGAGGANAKGGGLGNGGASAAGAAGNGGVNGKGGASAGGAAGNGGAMGKGGASAVGGATGTGGTGTGDEWPNIRVVGNRLCDRWGKPFALRSIESMFGNGSSNASAFVAGHKALGANALGPLPNSSVSGAGDIQELLAAAYEAGLVIGLNADHTNQGERFFQNAQIQAIINRYPNVFLQEAVELGSDMSESQWVQAAKDKVDAYVELYPDKPQARQEGAGGVSGLWSAVPGFRQAPMRVVWPEPSGRL